MTLGTVEAPRTLSETNWPLGVGQWRVLCCHFQHCGFILSAFAWNAPGPLTACVVFP